MSELDARIRALAKRFLPEWRERADALERALLSDPVDLPTAEDAAHQLAGALGSFGFGESGAAVRAIEAALRAGDQAGAIESLPGFRALFGIVRAELEDEKGPTEV